MSIKSKLTSMVNLPIKFFFLSNLNHFWRDRDFFEFGHFGPNFKVPAEFLILTKSHFETSFVIHLYISLSGLISFLIVQSFANSDHPSMDTYPAYFHRPKFYLHPIHVYILDFWKIEFETFSENQVGWIYIVSNGSARLGLITIIYIV